MGLVPVKLVFMTAMIIFISYSLARARTNKNAACTLWPTWYNVTGTYSCARIQLDKTTAVVYETKA